MHIPDGYLSPLFSLGSGLVTVPVWGKLSDLYGRRIMYQLGIGVFLLGTLLSGLAVSMNQLIIFRAIQGLGAGALIPLGMTIIGDTFTLKERSRMQAYFSGVWGLSSVVGPIIGGFITDQISWRWVFFVNLPIGVIAAITLWRTRQARRIPFTAASLSTPRPTRQLQLASQQS